MSEDFEMLKEILEMDPRLKSTIVAASLGAFAVETADLVFHEVKIGHALPSAMQMGTATTGSTTTVFVYSSAITEAVYPGVAGTQVLKGDGQVQLPLPPKPGPKA